MARKSQLQIGTEIELEHVKTIKKFKRPGVSVEEVARMIAKDHLAEDKNYYKKLKIIEK